MMQFNTMDNFHSKLVSQLETKKSLLPTVTITAAAPLTPPSDSPALDTTSEVGWSVDTPARTESISSVTPDAIVAVIGVGYVGTHLVEAFARHYQVVAFDLSEKRLQAVAEDLKGLPIRFTSEASDINEATHILIAVPTVLKADKTIDTTYLRSAISTVEQYAKPGSTVVVESSVAVGMTRQLVGPLMASKNLKVGMSPERVDPGRVAPAFEEIPKIVSGLDAESLESIGELYGRVFNNMLPVSSPEVAEMTKLYENCQRMVCAAYANEMADACSALGIDAFEVSQAAASKPFGYLPFKPGPGIGGHCIPVNPYYLLSTCSMPLLEQATQKSWQRPADVAKRFYEALPQEQTFTASGAVARASRPRILVVGVGFKRGQSVMSNSPGAAIIRTLLSEYDVYVEFADPLVAAESLDFVPRMDTDTNWNKEYLNAFSGILVAVDQVGLDMSILDQLKDVKIEDYSGRRQSFFNLQSAPTPSSVLPMKMC